METLELSKKMNLNQVHEMRIKLLELRLEKEKQKKETAVKTSKLAIWVFVISLYALYILGGFKL